MSQPLRLVFLGLSITSSWGNGHATTYRALVRALHSLGHEITFLERDVPWYAENRDELAPAGCTVELYSSLEDLQARFEPLLRQSDAVLVGSYVPDGAEVLEWAIATARGLTLFYDIDTPITLARLEANEKGYIARESIPKLDAYLSFTGGPTLELIEQQLGAPVALPLYCSVDAELYTAGGVAPHRDLGYLGTYSADRQPTLDRLLTEPARKFAEGRFVVAGPCYPELPWPANVERVEHVPPGQHPQFYSSLRYTLNVTRADMVRLGYSPSVRLFEAAACGVPIISDRWEGMDQFFEPQSEILLADTTEEVLEYLRTLPETTRQAVAQGARNRVLRQHTSIHRARQLEHYLRELAGGRARALRASRAQEGRPRRASESSLAAGTGAEP